MNERLNTNVALTDKKKSGRKATPTDLLLKTWSGTLQDEGDLSEDWSSCRGLLVGIGPPESAERHAD